MESISHLMKWSQFGGIASMAAACVFILWIGNRIFLSKKDFDRECRENRRDCQAHICGEIKKIVDKIDEQEKKRDAAAVINQEFRETVISHMSKWETIEDWIKKNSH